MPKSQNRRKNGKRSSAGHGRRILQKANIERQNIQKKAELLRSIRLLAIFTPLGKDEGFLSECEQFARTSLEKHKLFNGAYATEDCYKEVSDWMEAQVTERLGSADWMDWDKETEEA